MADILSDYYRLLRAGTVLARHDVVLPGAYQSRLPVAARLAGMVLRLFSGPSSGRPGERLARALERLGPAYIKLGQFLATRPDVFGPEVAGDLSRLKDRLAPFSMSKAREALADEFGPEAAGRLFQELSDPVAAASLAQVHRMKLPDGDRAVKILRPGIEARLSAELSAMGRAARAIEDVSPDSRRLRPVAFTRTIAAAMMKETDLRLEAGGGDEMRQIYTETGFFRVPRIDWERTGKRVLTTEWIEGTPLTMPGVFDRPGLNRVRLANDITQGFLSSAINHGVFHADMHEGNAILTPEGTIALVDFGIIGRIGPAERRFLAEILWGFLKRDYQRIAEVHFEAGYVPPEYSTGDFAQALRSIGEPLFGRPAEEVSMGRVLLQLFDYTHTFGMALRPELVLLQKTMVQVEGVARSIDPGHNIWTASEPVIREWMAANFGPQGAARMIAENLREVTNRLKRLPQIMDRFEESLVTASVEKTTGRDGAPHWGWFALAGILALALGLAGFGQIW